jgi:chromosome-anchoring protein RacA
MKFIQMGGFILNTGEVAKLLGVSISTIQRWVKQLGLPMEKNERGHYLFKEEDIELIKQIHHKIQQGVLLQDIAPLYEKKARKGALKDTKNDQAIEMLSTKMAEMETRLNEKADSVTSYQLIQHRREIEDLQNQIKNLINRIATLENQLKPQPSNEKAPVLDQVDKGRKAKKKNFVSGLFGF